jgi:dolichol-phosphate mannosyltransferase
MPERILVFIPVYNCENQIDRVLAQLDKDTAALFAQIIVVDNGSPDKTIERAQAAAATVPLPVSIFRNNQNYGLGGSIKSAFLYAMQNNFDYVVTLHGDDQGHIEDAARQIKSGRHRAHDFMIGARFHPESTLEGYSLIRTLGNQAFNILCSLITQRKIHDMIAGLNIYRVDYVRSLFFLPFPDDLTFDAHFLLYSVYKKADFDYFPLRWREEDQISNAKVFRQGWIILKLFGAYVFGNKDCLFSTNKSGYGPYFRYPATLVYRNDPPA